jgi:hypothetical protein
MNKPEGLIDDGDPAEVFSAASSTCQPRDHSCMSAAPWAPAPVGAHHGP